MHQERDKFPVCTHVCKELPDGSFQLSVNGCLNSAGVAALWYPVGDALAHFSAGGRVVVDAAGITRCDAAGVYFLLELRRRRQAQGGVLEIINFPAAFRPLLDLAAKVALVPTAEIQGGTPWLAQIGRIVVDLAHDLREMTVFIGEVLVAFGLVLRHPRHLRWRDFWLVFEKAGVNALPIVVMLGALLGLILAFQSAIPLRRFGADIFVANLVAISLFRELGPLLTAIILAGRSGAAFAAELGTMKINEELNALATMGLDPVRFLVVTRVLAAIMVMPLLVLFANLFGLVTFKNQVLSTVHLKDLLGGLFKSGVFGLLVAGVGCLRGLQTKNGAGAVGDATTRAVVSGIVLIVIVDGLFAVVFYCLGL